MKKIFLIVIGTFIFIGCSNKVITKKDISISQQKQDAKRAWKELDKN